MNGTINPEFSYRTRAEDLNRLASQEFDLLIVGGGITGVAVARDAVSRGLKVALVEKGDFASGTSSASSKLIHGGLRYLENFEFSLVFEALSERTHLLKTSPHLVRPLQFYLPVYKGERRGRFILSIGLWLYDLLARFAPPGIHHRLSRDDLLREVPHLKREGLSGGFTYYDASMWDDVLTVENARTARAHGAGVLNYIEAVEPLWQHGSIRGFWIQDRENPKSSRILVHAKKTVICAGVWTDKIGELLLTNAPSRERPSKGWSKWLEPSRGTHLVFSSKRFKMPGAMLMTHPEDGRVAFVIPRFDFGAGVVIVGTTDGPAPSDPEKIKVPDEDIDYLLDLLKRYFPELGLTRADIISTYIGIRPLVGSHAASLQSVSREHHVDRGPGGTILVAGGKYTTHRTMAKHIVDFTLRAWEEDYFQDRAPRPPHYRSKPEVEGGLNPAVKPSSYPMVLKEPFGSPLAALQARYGDDARAVIQYSSGDEALSSPEGFPYLSAQLVYAIRCEMVMHLEDFYFRRAPLYLARADHGWPWAEGLSRVWMRERGVGEAERVAELKRLEKRIEERKNGNR